ncbi:MAG: glycosyltransferase [Muribaculaceae bacterium]|nr:glycosyltransferase [Muribaculaceae bacterium]
MQFQWYNFSVGTTWWEWVLLLAPVATLLLSIPYFLSVSRPRRRAEAYEPAAPGTREGISVIVYCREDAASLSRLLGTLMNQDYEGEYEVIIVSDGRPDATSDVYNSLAIKHKNLYLTFVPDEAHNISRRKLAITLGVKAAHYPIILCTEADAVVTKGWVRSVAECFDKDTQVVITPVSPLELWGSGLPEAVRTLDAASGTVIYLDSALTGRPYRGNSYSLAYRKQLFISHKGFSRSLTLHYGDDDIFVSEIATSENTRVALGSDSLVRLGWSNPQRAFRESKLRRSFTEKGLGRRARLIAGSGPMLAWTGVLSAVGSIVAEALTGGGVLTSIAVALVAMTAYMAAAAMTWRGTLEMLGLKIAGILVAPAILIRPLYNAAYGVASRKTRTRNYTWGNSVRK